MKEAYSMILKNFLVIICWEIIFFENFKIILYLVLLSIISGLKFDFVLCECLSYSEILLMKTCMSANYNFISMDLCNS
jgi:hypothetical protein